MFIERQNPRGGRKLKGFTLHVVDNQIGYKIGYHAGEPILVRISDAQEICEAFGYSFKKNRGLLARLFDNY